MDFIELFGFFKQFFDFFKIGFYWLLRQLNQINLKVFFDFKSLQFKKIVVFNLYFEIRIGLNLNLFFMGQVFF